MKKSAMGVTASKVMGAYAKRKGCVNNEKLFF